MAEGDTILRLARRLDRALAGEALAVSAPNPRGRAGGIERLDGRRLESVESRGKHLLLSFGDLVLHSHLGMSGAWHVYAAGERWRRPRRAAWAVLAGRDAEAAEFGGPTLRVASATALRADPVLARLGPDVLAPRFDRDEAVLRLGRDPARALGEALLDQRAVAGVGNIFKSEACFAARVDPWTAVGDLREGEVESVLEAARQLMLASVEGGRRPLAVYRRGGRPCPRCGAPIAAAAQGDESRPTYWCRRCQPPRRA